MALLTNVKFIGFFVFFKKNNSFDIKNNALRDCICVI